MKTIDREAEMLHTCQAVYSSNLAEEMNLPWKQSNQTCLETVFAELADVCYMTHAMDIRHNLEPSKAV